MPELKSITYENLRYERRIEFALEGQYWYDLLRRSYYQQQEVVNYLNNQERNAVTNGMKSETCRMPRAATEPV